jgi:hypothetical protein
MVYRAPQKEKGGRFSLQCFTTWVEGMASLQGFTTGVDSSSSLKGFTTIGGRGASLWSTGHHKRRKGGGNV